VLGAAGGNAGLRPVFCVSISEFTRTRGSHSRSALGRDVIRSVHNGISDRHFSLHYNPNCCDDSVKLEGRVTRASQ
jgi:hypothetical protein